jgi:hypothetical protein
VDAGDGSPDDVGEQVAAYGFDFGELRHVFWTLAR